MTTITVQTFVDNWCAQLRTLFDNVAAVAARSGWTSAFTTEEVTEDPFGLGANLDYQAPVLVLKRPMSDGSEERITFEPRHRYTLGAAGRIDVYSYPKLREAMLLRILDPGDTKNLTLDEAEELVAGAPWKAFSPERLPLQVIISHEDSLRKFLEDLVA